MSRTPKAEQQPTRTSTRRKMLGRFAVALAAVAIALGFFGVDELLSTAEAQRGLRARVYITQAAIPRNLSERGLIGFARRHRARRLRETTEQPIPERQWRANMVTAFNRPVGDLEFQVLFYDIEDGERRFIGPPLSTFINNRDEKTFVQRIRLERPQFAPNRRMELVVTVRRNEVGRARFEVVGERIQHSGEVTF